LNSSICTGVLIQSPAGEVLPINHFPWTTKLQTSENLVHAGDSLDFTNFGSWYHC